MKRLTLCLFLLLGVCSTAFTRPAARLERRVQERVEQQQSVLYTTVEQALKHYYGKDYAPDPQRTTGWYRVDDFLTWVTRNSRELEQALKPSYVQTLYQYPDSWTARSLWISLGARYIVSVYGVEADLSKLDIMYCDNENCAVTGTGWMRVSPPEGMPVPALINLGIHEATHMFPYLISGENKSLTELATFYSQYNYGLPVKSSDMDEFAYGVRDIRRAQELRSDLTLASEYNYFIAGLLLKPLLSKREILQATQGFFDSRGHVNMAIWQTVLNLIALRDGNFWKQEYLFLHSLSEEDLRALHFTQQDMERCKAQPEAFFYVGKRRDSISNKKEALFARFDEKQNKVIFYTGFRRVTKEAYLQRLFGDRAPYLYDFYDRVLNNLPKELVKEVRRQWPVQTDQMFLPASGQSTGWQKFGKPYSAQITQAVVKALEQSGAPAVPPIPPGYF
ncbi:MAG: hypothetical protein MJ053_06480 [Elusimicrobiaceae bacterium]|nr:hypothetical protein [Elusimicrobiaceae bacterium]